MTDLKTYYAGIELKNPIIVGASNLVTAPNNLILLEQAGASAIVYKSLFEEQIQIESYQLENTMSKYSHWDSEHETMFPQVEHAGPAEHLLQLKKAKKMLSIPLIGSLNCVSKDTWGEYAVKMADTGIDALELNFYASELNPVTQPEVIEESEMETLNVVRNAIKIPVIVKLSPFYTNTLGHVVELDRSGADGFVLFNRLFQPDIDIQKEEHHFPYNFSSENDNRLALRYAGLLYGKTKGSICCNTGIFTGADVIKMLLAGADAVQVVSAIYKKGMDHIGHMIHDLETWMEKKGYAKLDDFRGKLSRGKLIDPFVYKRAQYVDILMKSEIFMQYHPKDRDWDDDSL
ncbi:MAG TPA: dihydroorotate dehydrogenase-like protein [Cyclobacteriaceae bacterium]|nr:dihydroorotate dehydrogenase-like protein [Cyclobacteriaceae bacterium]